LSDQVIPCLEDLPLVVVLVAVESTEALSRCLADLFLLELVLTPLDHSAPQVDMAEAVRQVLVLPIRTLIEELAVFPGKVVAAVDPLLRKLTSLAIAFWCHALDFQILTDHNDFLYYFIIDSLENPTTMRLPLQDTWTCSCKQYTACSFFFVANRKAVHNIHKIKYHSFKNVFFLQSHVCIYVVFNRLF
jgi:hypothetical protein